MDDWKVRSDLNHTAPSFCKKMLKMNRGLKEGHFYRVDCWARLEPWSCMSASRFPSMSLLSQVRSCRDLSTSCRSSGDSWQLEEGCKKCARLWQGSSINDTIVLNLVGLINDTIVLSLLGLINGNFVLSVVGLISDTFVLNPVGLTNDTEHTTTPKLGWMTMPHLLKVNSYTAHCSTCFSRAFPHTCSTSTFLAPSVVTICKNAPYGQAGNDGAGIAASPAINMDCAKWAGNLFSYLSEWHSLAAAVGEAAPNWQDPGSSNPHPGPLELQ